MGVMDIVFRLRYIAEHGDHEWHSRPALLRDAADEIDRLRAENERLREAIERHRAEILDGECPTDMQHLADLKLWGVLAAAREEEPPHGASCPCAKCDGR